MNKTTQDAVNQYELLNPLLTGIYKEMQELSKKKPDSPLNAFKVKAINRILEPIKEMLKMENTHAFLDVLDVDEMPTNSDVVLVLNQYMNAMKIFSRKSTHNRRERPVCGHRGRSRGPFYYRITTFGKGPWDARDPHKTTFMALKHVIRLSIWQRQKETPGVEKAPGVSSPQRKESGRSGRDDGELRFGYDPAIHARRLRVYHRPRRLRMASRISIFFAARRFEPLNSMG